MNGFTRSATFLGIGADRFISYSSFLGRLSRLFLSIRFVRKEIELPIAPAAPPIAIRAYGGFDYVTVDAKRRRVYAAHTSSKRLLVLDADTGKVLGQVDVGPMHGVAVDPVTGDVFTGDGTDDKVSKVDPVAMKVIAEASVPGPVDAIAYDPKLGRVYADEDSGTDVYVVDGKTMKQVGSVRLPGHDEEYLAVDPATQAVYQNIPDLNEFVVVDPSALKVSKTVPTPELTDNHPLAYDPGLHQIIVGGKNGKLSVYTPAGKLVGSVTYPMDVDQCSLDEEHHELACAGNGTLAVLNLHPGAAPTPGGQIDTHHDVHTVAIDPATQTLWTVWSGPDGDFAGHYKTLP
jgi:DNA-binding beta-propeller fold protein YncE